MTAPDPELAEHDGPIVRDKRKVDPLTGEVRVHDTALAESGTDAADVVPDDGPAALEAQLAERTNDLQRVTAEFANYRKRVERDRQVVAEQALASILIGVLPVLDDIDRAREHGEVEGGFKSVADNLETTLTKLGLVRYGEAGEPFNPTVHDALMHAYASDVTEPTCTTILQPGYRIGERVLRPARVAVTEPGEPDAVLEGADQ
jgi:molecular chaperone GrpE